PESSSGKLGRAIELQQRGGRKRRIESWREWGTMGPGWERGAVAKAGAFKTAIAGRGLFEPARWNGEGVGKG
ncbi:MAG: hypothetical protein ACK6DB_03240, partial [Planctomycetota bacterium]